MYCLGTNPVEKQRKRKVSQETDQKTTFKTTTCGHMNGRMTCRRFQSKTSETAGAKTVFQMDACVRSSGRLTLLQKMKKIPVFQTGARASPSSRFTPSTRRRKRQNEQWRFK